MLFKVQCLIWIMDNHEILWTSDESIHTFWFLFLITLWISAKHKLNHEHYVNPRRWAKRLLCIHSSFHFNLGVQELRALCVVSWIELCNLDSGNSGYQCHYHYYLFKWLCCYIQNVDDRQCLLMGWLFYLCFLFGFEVIGIWYSIQNHIIAYNRMEHLLEMENERRTMKLC